MKNSGIHGEAQEPHPNVAVRTTDAFGRVLHAIKAFESGEVVFIESPILLSLPSLSQDEDTLLKLASETSGLNLVEDFLFAKSFCLSDEQHRQSVLDCYSPSSIELKNSPLLTSILNVVDACKRFAWSSGIASETLEKVVLVKACNAHGCFSQSNASAALYSLGSKMRHSCTPNVVYTSQRVRGLGSFIAKKRIKAGEELFISYIPTARSVPMRQRVLRENYLFECRCESCTSEVDVFRGLNCACGGTMFRNQATQIWTCRDCAGVFTDADKPISDADESLLVEETLKILDSFQVESKSILNATLERLYTKLGPKHAISKLVEKAFIEYHLLTSYAVVEHRADQIKNLTDSILEWCGNDPDFLDSVLIELGCALGRVGDFETAKGYLNIVLKDMQFLFGTDAADDNEPLGWVIRAIRACEAHDPEAVPDFIGGTNL